MRLLHAYLATILLSPLVSARQPPTSFCKCICFQNSTIIPLNAPPSQSGFNLEQQATNITAANATSASVRDSSIADPLSVISERDEEKVADVDGERKHRELTCNDCNRAFCIDNVCKDAKEEDVFTTCFQRDSLKDETVVLIFVILTTSLLVWAVLKPYVDKFRNNASLSTYVSLGSGRSSGRGHTSGGLPIARGTAEYTDIAQDPRTEADGADGISRYDRLDR